jgi:hypothetical protein
MDAMYARLVQLFGSGFETRNGEEPNCDWIDLFSRMTDEQLARGVKNARGDKRFCFEGGKQFFPPDADAFEVYCKRPRSDDPKALPNPYALSEALKGTARYYGIDYENKTEDEVNHLIWEARRA